MKSNGFGSWRTSIRVNVPIAYAREAELRLGVAPFQLRDDPSIACFKVSFPAPRRGDDESIVWQMFETLGHPEKLPWTIDWDSSDY